MNKRLLSILAAGILMSFVTGTANAVLWSSQTSSTVKVVKISNGGDIYDGGLNDIGQVAISECQSSTGEYSFIWNSTTNTKTNVGALGGLVGSQILGINNAGQVTGSSGINDGSGSLEALHAFVWNPATNAMTDLGTLGGNYSQGYGINDAGMVAGQANLSGTSALHAFVWNPATNAMTDLGTLGGSYSEGREINNAGQVAGTSSLADNSGYHAFVWNPVTKAMTDLGTLGGSYSDAMGINDAGLVVGQASLGGNSAYHAFVWNPVTDTMTDLGAFGGDFSRGLGINEVGQVTGLSRLGIDDDYIDHAFVWENETMYDLNSLVTLALGEHLMDGLAINNQSQIVARSSFGRLYLLTPTATATPVPVPSTMLLLVSGIIGLASITRRKR